MSLSFPGVRSALTGGWLFMTASLTVQAAIVVVQVPEERRSCLSAGDQISCVFDIDGNGVNEFEFVSGANFSNGIRVFGTSGIVLAPFRLENVQEVAPLPYGQMIGQPLDDDPSILGVTGGPRTLLLSYGFDGGQGGAFYDQDAYFGFAIIKNGGQNRLLDVYYGWFHIQDVAGLGPLLYEYAYQTEPATSIFAGQIPEPSTTVLIGGGTALLLQRNRTQTKQNKALQRTARGWVVSTLRLIRKSLGFGGAQPRP